MLRGSCPQERRQYRQNMDVSEGPWHNEGVGRRRKWENEEMWAQAVEWRCGGLTYRDIAGRLTQSRYRRRFGLEDSPSEDTVRREVRLRLSPISDAAAPGESPGWSPVGTTLVAEAHYRELFAFGQRLRDRLFIPAPR